MGFRGREIGILKSLPRDRRLDLLEIGVEDKLAVLELVTERLLTPDIAAARRDKQRRGSVAVDSQVDALVGRRTVGLALAIATAAAPPAFRFYQRNFRNEDFC